MEKKKAVHLTKRLLYRSSVVVILLMVFVMSYTYFKDADIEGMAARPLLPRTYNTTPENSYCDENPEMPECEAYSDSS